MKYGFIGCGNMGSSLAKALSCATKDILLADYSLDKAITLSKELGCRYAIRNEEVIAKCDRIFLGVKPQMLSGVLEPLRPLLQESKPLLISMAAGISLARLEVLAGSGIPTIRIMPNTPVAVGKGMVSYVCNDLVTEAMLQDFLADMEPGGRFLPIPESQMDAATALAGCSPAYCYMFLEALADGAVACGLPRDKAMEMAAATLAGAAQMVLSTGKHPGELKDAVCSPAGSTIAGVRVLEEKAFRGAIIDCIQAAYQRNIALGK